MSGTCRSILLRPGRKFVRILPILTSLAIASCNRAPEPSANGVQAARPESIVAHGARLSRVLGCTGCHGPALEGAPIAPGRPLAGTLNASNLTLVLPGYSDAQLRVIIRAGVHPTRRDLWGMPSQIFQFLGARDYDSLIAYLRTIRPSGRALPPPQLSERDRQGIAAGLTKPAARLVEDYRRAQPIELGPRYAFGRYIASVTCTGCHGAALGGDPVNRAPDLAVVGAYDPEDFARLMGTGVGQSGRTLDPMMRYAARGRYSHLTTSERGALYDYLRARADVGR
jgi:mono/diheme cytochrome c family protein